MFFEELHAYNSYRHTDHPKYTLLTKGTVILYEMLQNYFNDSLLHHMLCEIFSSDGSESIKSTFTLSRHIKELPTVLKILCQRRIYDSSTLVEKQNDLTF